MVLGRKRNLDPIIRYLYCFYNKLIKIVYFFNYLLNKKNINIKSYSMTLFLGGVQLDDNIQVLSFKNDMQHWLSLYKDDKFIEFITTGAEIGTLTRSPCGTYIAYYQIDSGADMLNFELWKYNKNAQELVPCPMIKTPLSSALGLDITRICFSRDSKYVACLDEWNHINIINLLDDTVRTEFNILSDCDDIRPQTIYSGTENYFVWFGQDEYVRIIDLNGPYPTMWMDKLMFGSLNANYNSFTKYFFEFNGYIVFMNYKGTIVLAKPNLQDKRIQPEYNIKYPVTKYSDISIIDGKTLCFHTQTKQNGKTVCNEHIVKFN